MNGGFLQHKRHLVRPTFVCVCCLQGGSPIGDRGLVHLEDIKSVEKVVGVDTFVMKGGMKVSCILLRWAKVRSKLIVLPPLPTVDYIAPSQVYMLKLEPHDEATMRTWIAAIAQQLRSH